MKPWIESVLALQALDMKLRNFRIKLATLPSEKARLDSELAEAAKTVTAARDALRSVEKQIKETEQKIAQLDEGVRKLLTQSIMIRKNDEYQVMMSDIENKKKEASDLETVELELMEKSDSAKIELARAERDFNANSKSIRDEIGELAGLEKEIRGEITAAESLRKAHESKVEMKVLDIYSRILAGKKGEPVARIVEGGICSNCRLKLTPMTINEARKGGIVLCDNCSHLVYFPDNPVS